MSSEKSTGVRIDRWLWAARFFKTRSLTSTTVQGGHVQINNQRAKPSRLVKIDDHIVLQRGFEQYELVVTGLAEKRGSATIAATLFQETEASINDRVEKAAQRKAQYASEAQTPRPNKKQRRQIVRFKQRD